MRILPLVLICLARPALAADDLLSRLVTALGDKPACFSRTYDDAFLRGHPRQTVAGVLALVAAAPGGGVSFNVAFRRKGETGFAAQSGGCGWSEHANRDVNDRRLIPQFRKEAGADCIMTMTPGSDEEGGDGMVLDPSADGRNLTLYTGSTVATVTGASGRWKRGDLRLGPDDRVFRLDRGETAACAPLERITGG